jgi:hypothetical protein
MFSLETLDASALRGDSATPKLPCDTFASATLAPCGDTLFLRGLPSETKPALFPEMNQTAVLFPSPPLQPHAKKIPPLVFSSIPSL